MDSHNKCDMAWTEKGKKERISLEYYTATYSYIILVKSLINWSGWSCVSTAPFLKQIAPINVLVQIHVMVTDRQDSSFAVWHHLFPCQYFSLAVWLNVIQCQTVTNFISLHVKFLLLLSDSISFHIKILLQLTPSLSTSKFFSCCLTPCLYLSSSYRSSKSILNEVLN